MIRLQAAACAAMALAGTAVGQTRPTSATYEMRLVPQGAAAGLTPGSTSTLTTFTFVVQARAATAAGTTNYGVHRFSSATITAFSGTLVRGQSNGTNFGRFRGLGLVNNFAAQAAGAGSNSASGNAAGLDAASNVNGRFNAESTSISQIDAWRGVRTSSVDPVTGDPLPNPFDATLVTDGTPSVWANLYSVTINVNPGTSIFGWGLYVQGFLTIGASATDAGGEWSIETLPATFVGVGWNIPSPPIAALFGLGGLAAARRRRPA